MSTVISRRQVMAVGATLAGSAALAVSPLGMPTATASTSAGKQPSEVKPTIMLVHGGYADSSCWNETIRELQCKGYPTIAGSNPLRGIPTDAPYIGSLLDSVSGPVGRALDGWDSYHQRCGRKDKCQSVGLHRSIHAGCGGDARGAHHQVPRQRSPAVSMPVRYTKADGTTGTDLYLSKDGHAAFAADIPAAAFRVLHATQRPFDADSFTYPTTAAAWKTIPSWCLVAGRDKAIPPVCERWMYHRAKARKIVEVPTSSHVAMISHPRIVADLIEDAAQATC